MKKIDNDIFYDFIKQYDPDSQYHLVGEVEYHLLCDEKPYEGMSSHTVDPLMMNVFITLKEKRILYHKYNLQNDLCVI